MAIAREDREMCRLIGEHGVELIPETGLESSPTATPGPWPPGGWGRPWPPSIPPMPGVFPSSCLPTKPGPSSRELA